MLLVAFFELDLISAFALLLGVALPICAIADALSRPEVAFREAGSHRMAWIIMLFVALFLGLGFFFSAYYLISVRGKVKAQMSAS